MRDGSDAITTNGNAGPVAGPLCGARDQDDPAAAGHSARDGDRDQTSGRGPAFAQDPEAGCQRRPQHGVPNAATAKAPWAD